jgi:hypothetical protein
MANLRSMCCWPTWRSRWTRSAARAWQRLRATLVGWSAERADGSDAVGRTPATSAATCVVRHIIGLDPARRGVAVAHHVTEGMQLAFCQRDVQAARADLVRICAEIREELEP